MPTIKRHKTSYPGVVYIIGKSVSRKKSERIYYIRYRKDGKPVEEKAGRQFADDMTPARASRLRAKRIEGKEPSNSERRQLEKAKKEAEAGKWTIDRLWGQYKKNNPNLKGIAIDQNRYDNHIKPKLKDKEPKDLLPLDVDRLRLKLLKTKAPATVKHVLELLRRIINFGTKKNLCDGSGFTIEMPKVHNEKTEDLTPEQLTKLLETIDASSNIQAGNMMKMALFTGMRRGELFKLKWKDIDSDRGFITLKDPKGGPDQKIPLNDGAKQIIEGHPRLRSKYVFPGRRGQKRTGIKPQVNKIKKDAGLPGDFRALHGLRHVYASMLASSGQVDLYTLQKLLTHKSSVMVQRYAHLRDESLKKASGLAGSIIEEAANKSEKNNEDKVVNIEDHSK